MARVQGVTIGIDADASQFNKSIKKMNREIRGTQQEIFNLTKSLEFEWDVNKFTRAQKLAQQALNDTNAKAQVLRERLQFLDEQGTDKTSQEYRKLEQQLASTERQALQMQDKLEKINNLPIENVKKKFDDLGTSIENVGNKLVPVSAAAGALLAGFAKVGIDAVSLGDDIGTTAQQLNIATQELQKWRFIAEQTDVDNAKLEMGFRKIQAGLGALAVGDTTDPIAIALEELGFTAEQASLGMEENFEKVIGALVDMEDATEQAYLANEIFGTRIGALIIPLLNEGGEALAELSDEFETFNTLTDEQVQALDAYEDAWQKVLFGFKTVAAQLGSSLLPVFEQLSGFLNNTILPVITKVAEAFGNLSLTQKNVILSVLGFVTALAPTLLIVGKLTKAIGPLVANFGKFIGILAKIGPLLAANPIVAVVGGIIVVLGVLLTKSEELRTAFSELFNTVGTALQPIFEALGAVLSSVGGLFGSLVNLLGSVLVPALILVTKVLTPVIELLGNGLARSLGLVTGPLLVIVDTLTKIINFLADGITDGINNFIDGIKFLFSLLPSIFNKGVDLFESFVNTVIRGINGLIERVNSVSEIFGKTFNKVNEVDIKFNYDNVEDIASDIGSRISGNSTAPTIDDTVTQDILTDVTPMSNIDTVNNYDSSTKNIEINVTVENFADELDTDALIEEINLKLAQQF